MATKTVEKAEPRDRGVMTYGWLVERAEEKVQKEWLDVCWNSLIAEMYGVNIAVWEPSGSEQTVQLYKSDNLWGLFLFDKKVKHDEAGHKWVHLLYRTGGSWDARGGVGGAAGEHSTHNHFDYLELGTDFAASFETTVDVARQARADLDQPLPLPLPLPPSPVPTKKRKAAASARLPLRQSPSSKKVEGGSRARPKRKAKEPERGGGDSKKKKQPSEGGGYKSKGGAAASSPNEVEEELKEENYDSDGSFGGGEEDWSDPKRKGSHASLTKNAKTLRRSLKKIEEAPYRRAFEAVNKMKTRAAKLRDARQRKEEAMNPKKKKAKTTKNKQPPPLEEEEESDDGAEWTERGMEDYENSDAHTRRSKKEGAGSEVSLSATSRERMPSLDDFLDRTDPADGRFALQHVLEECFDMNFPGAARKLFVDKTNAYVKHCTTEPQPGEEDTRRLHQVKKSRTLGQITLDDPAIEGQGQPFLERHICGMIGISITMGLTKKTRMRKHWSKSEHDDYPLVRRCMQCDLFELLYCRFLHCSDPNAPPRLLPDGEDNPAYDSKWHIRELEEILNSAWSGNVDVNQWLCYNEQMVKTVATYAKRLSHYNPAKPISQGMKQLAACDVKGYCLINSVDGGMKGDPKLRPYMDCPLGRTTRHMLHVLLGECEVLREKLEGSGVFIAMDNYFTSPTLFECLASHDIFAVGTCRANRTAGAQGFLQSLGRTIPNRGDMNFCRSGEVAFVQWKDSKDIFLCSTIHIAQPKPGSKSGIDHFKPLPLALKASGGKGKHLFLEQPLMRFDYVRWMGGVDSADQQNGSHTHDHKAYANFWRRMFDAKIEQALTNAFLIFRKWVQLLIREVEARMLTVAGGGLQELDKASTELTRLAKVERAVWDEEMSTMLMAKCNVGSLNKGGRCKKQPDRKAKWGSVTLKGARSCMNYECTKRTTKGCTCEAFCTQGDESGVLMCQTCFFDPKSHEQAAETRWHGVDGKRTRTDFEWQQKV